MRRMIAAAVVALLVGCVGGFVLHGQGDMQILGAGNISCGKWLEYRPGNALSPWVNGYLTGFQDGARVGLTDNQAGDLEGRSAWIDQYCQSHPIDTLRKASSELFDALRAKR